MTVTSPIVWLLFLALVLVMAMVWAKNYGGTARSVVAFEAREPIDGGEECVRLTAWVSEERIVIGHSEFVEEGEKELCPRSWCCERVM